MTQRDDEIGRLWRLIRGGGTLQTIGMKDVKRQLDHLREQREFKIEIDRIRGDIVGGDILDQKRFVAMRIPAILLGFIGIGVLRPSLGMAQ